MTGRKKFSQGDVVEHKYRGLCEFEYYTADNSVCFVKMRDTKDSEKVSTELLKLTRGAQEAGDDQTTFTS